MKCGTTSFWEDVTAHPQIDPGIAKEVLYFDQYHRRSESWYRAFFYDTSSERRHHGDASLSYLPCAHAPERAATLVPDAKLVVLLRDPVDRAISHYFHARRRNEEPLALDEVITREAAEIDAAGEVLFPDPDGDWPRFSYLRRGHYAAQLEQWLRFFPREQLLCVRSEDYFDSPGEVLARAFTFLGVEPIVPASFARAGERGDYLSVDGAVRDRISAHFEAPNEALRELTDGEIVWGQRG